MLTVYVTETVLEPASWDFSVEWEKAVSDLETLTVLGLRFEEH